MYMRKIRGPRILGEEREKLNALQAECEEKANSLNLEKTFYVIATSEQKPMVYEVKASKAFASRDVYRLGYDVSLIIGDYGTFSLGKTIFETKEEAIDKIVEEKQERLKKLASQFKEEKKYLDEMLDDVEGVFTKLKTIDKPKKTIDFWNRYYYTPSAYAWSTASTTATTYNL